MINVLKNWWSGERSAARRKNRPARRTVLTVEALEARENPSAPAAPWFSATAVSATQINLSWGRVAGANGYLVDEVINGAWRQIGNVGSGSTGFSVTGLSPNTTYTFDVGAYNAAGTNWASPQSATTRGNTVTGDHPAAGQAYSPVSGSLFGANGPSYLDVRQGGVGDCWLLASLAEVAARNPADIRNMFTYQGTAVENGATVSLYSVRFFDNSGTAHYVTVDTELPAGGGEYDHPVNGVLWVALAEKAYAEANGMRFVTTQHVGTDSYSALDGGDAAWALRAITGKSASDISINPSNIAAAWNAGKLIVLCTNHPASSYIVGNHCYALVAYNGSSSRPFEIYNPWGTDSSGWVPGLTNKTYGLFWANGTALSQNFAFAGVGVGAEEGTGLTGGTDIANTPGPWEHLAGTSSFRATDAVVSSISANSTPAPTFADVVASLRLRLDEPVKAPASFLESGAPMDEAVWQHELAV
jgi:hypothetical protein